MVNKHMQPNPEQGYLALLTSDLFFQKARVILFSMKFVMTFTTPCAACCMCTTDDLSCLGAER